MNLKNLRLRDQAGLISLGAILLVFILVAVFVDISSLKDLVIRAGVWGPIIFILLKISTVVISPLSGTPLYPLVGLLFGFWPGILYVVIGDFLAHTITFHISRIFGRKAVLRFVSSRDESIMSRIVDHIGDTKGFMQATLAFFALPEVLSYGAGLSRLKYIKFISILMPVLIAASSVLVFFGSILNPNSNSLVIGILLPLLAAMIVITGGALFIKAIKKKGGEENLI